MKEMTQKRSLSVEYFDDVYRANEDPWNFETSAYEAAKYKETLDILPRQSYESAFEIGCSIGVLTAQIAARCQKLLAVDVNQKALNKAADRCRDFPNVRFKMMQIPGEFPGELFDLIIVSEVGYYLNTHDWKIAQDKLTSHLKCKGNIVLVHWTNFVSDYPQTGDEVHDLFAEWSEKELKHIKSKRFTDYRIDVWEKL